MFSRAVFTWLPAGLFLVLFGVAFGFACSDDLEQGRRMNTGNPIGMPDGLPEEIIDPSKQPEECPPSQPKEGETCPGVSRTAVVTCRYVTRQCPDTSEVAQSMCCSRGSIWVPCGLNDPCPEPTEADAGM